MRGHWGLYDKDVKVQRRTVVTEAYRPVYNLPELLII